MKKRLHAGKKPSHREVLIVIESTWMWDTFLAILIGDIYFISKIK